MSKTKQLWHTLNDEEIAYIEELESINKELLEALKDVPLPRVGDNSDFIGRFYDWYDGNRQKAIERASNETVTTVLFRFPHRLDRRT